MGGTGEIVKLEREYFRQGYIYKNPNAYHNDKSAVCYVPELSDSAYTGQDFLDMCNGQPEIADQVFDAVDWQHPESYLDEQGDEELWRVVELVSVRIAEQKRRRRIMLADLLKALAEAGDKKEKEKVYRNLERVGMDRMTANVLVAEMRKEATANGK